MSEKTAGRYGSQASRAWLAVRALACVILLMTAAFAAAESAAPVTDAFGRKVEVGSAGRIVSLGPDVTEIAYALGVGDRIIAVDRGSKYPAATANKVNLGYRRKLNPEGIISMDADLILAAEDIGPPETIEILRSLAVPVVFVPEDNSAEGIARKISIIAGALSLREKGQALAKDVLAQMGEAARLAAAIPTQSRKRVVFFHGLTRLTAAGDGTAADAVIKLAGGLNPMDEVKGYKAASEERLIELAPDVVVMMGDGAGGPTPDEVFSNRALAATPAGRTRSLIVLDGAYMIGFGPRTADAVKDLAIALYGNAARRASDEDDETSSR